jgi:hypothetical protein
MRFVDRIDWEFVRRRTTWIIPVAFFGLSVVVVLKYVYTPLWLGIDASLYARASAAWLAGADPWAVNQAGIYYAAPPPTLLPFVPFAWMPPVVVSLTWIVGSFVLAWLAIRALALPIWWMAFPPIVDGALVGNPDVAVLALLVVGGGRLGVVAPFLKIYALIPMIGERRWRQVTAFAVLLGLTWFVLPWGQWFAQLPVITDHLINTAATTSIFGQPLLMAIAVIALLSLGLRRAGWLAVPILWPYTQFHYAAISVPGLSPYLALAWCFPTPEAWLAATCAAAIHHHIVRLRRARTAGPEVDVVPSPEPYRPGATKIDPSSSE